MKDWRKTREYRLWRAKVIRRDKVCKVCGSRERRQAHHLNHASYYTELRFDVNNGVCMCAKCHSKYHNDYHSSTKVRCTAVDWKNFMSLASYFKEIYNA